MVKIVLENYKRIICRRTEWNDFVSLKFSVISFSKMKRKYCKQNNKYYNNIKWYSAVYEILLKVNKLKTEVTQWLILLLCIMAFSVEMSLFVKRGLWKSVNTLLHSIYIKIWGIRGISILLWPSLSIITPTSLFSASLFPPDPSFFPISLCAPLAF